MPAKITLIVWWMVLSIATSLLIINLYGVTQSIRPRVIKPENLRFKNEHTNSFEKTIELIKKIPSETDSDYAYRLTKLIPNSLSHIHWTRYSPEKFNQLIPIWENYFLYLMGKFSGIPEYERYHYGNYEKSLKRGIGVCGDASMIMSQLLSQKSIENKIVSFPAHVVVEAHFDEGQAITFDPDFGVVLPFSINKINQNPNIINNYYSKKNYSKKEINTLEKAFKDDYKKWDGPSHFITKRYYFEKISYFLKWPLPVLLALISIYFIRNQTRKS